MGEEGEEEMTTRVLTDWTMPRSLMCLCECDDRSLLSAPSHLSAAMHRTSAASASVARTAVARNARSAMPVRGMATGKDIVFGVSRKG
jgi:hypothetical protein